MKKAYVKPVFLAEEFEGTACVAACDYHAGGDNSQVLIYNTLRLCPPSNNCDHAVGGNSNNGKYDGDIQNYWKYATNNDTLMEGPTNENYVNDTTDGAYLFTDGETVCDFVWNGGKSQVGIWTQYENNLGSAISNAGLRELGQSFITWVSDFAKFFGVNGIGSKEHKPGVNGQQFFS